MPLQASPPEKNSKNKVNQNYIIQQSDLICERASAQSGGLGAPPPEEIPLFHFSNPIGLLYLGCG
jgi:hypothetical protein